MRPPEPWVEDYNCGSYMLPVNFEILQDLLLQPNLPKSMWPNGIHPRLLKRLANVVARTHSVVYQRSWECEEVPGDWKIANLTPVFKKGKKEDAGNYQSVSLSSVSGKIMEKIILGVLEKHFKENAVIGQSQHGFMKGKSCHTNLISFYDKVTHLVDKWKAVDVWGVLF